MKTQRIVTIAAAGFGLSFAACAAGEAPLNASLGSFPKAVALPTAAGASPQVIRFLEDKVRRDPEDMVAQNKLVGAYLQRLRETGDIANLGLAAKAAQASLAILPPERNMGGLAAKTQVESTSHDFDNARKDALRLLAIDPTNAAYYQMLGDALFEMGRYSEAHSAFVKMAELGGNEGMLTIAVEQREAKFAALRGDLADSRLHLLTALRAALGQRQPSAETVAGTYWHLGDQAFDAGELELAEKFLTDSLITFPGYTRSLASLGHIRAAQEDWKGALAYYLKAKAAGPADLVVASELSGVYRKLGHEKEADAELERAKQIAGAHASLGPVYRRERAQFFANHEMNLEEAYQLAKVDYVVRHDAGGADVLAWTACKAGHIAEAEQAMKDALPYAKAEAPILFHAGFIAKQAGKPKEAQTLLTQALEVNPHFDPVEAEVARQMLRSLR